MRFAWALALISYLTVMVSCQVIKKGCPEKCGNVSIPYPFGIGESCALDEHFIINCNHTSSPPTPFLASLVDSLQVLDISFEGYLRMHTYVAHACYDSKGNTKKYFNASSWLGKFFFSSTRNNFTVVGCDTESMLQDITKYEIYYSGCISYCINKSTIINGSCNDIGCCQNSIPTGLSNYNVWFGSYYGHIYVRKFNPCSYAFIADKDYFSFTTANLQHMPRVVPTVIEWQIGTKNCQLAVKNESNYACKEHSECRDSVNGPGYLCFCSTGYQGNPYVSGGCVDVDECNTQNDCIHKCHNLEGSQGMYTCSCPSWYLGDGRKSGQGCIFNKHRLILVLVGDAALLTLIIVAILIANNLRRQRMQTILKEKFFKKNGGFILLDRIFQNEVGSNSITTMRIFQLEELNEATDNFSEGRICGRGGFGTVYKGNLPNGSIVAIKKSKVVDQDQVEQFINEITVLSQIKHRNVVRFLGCCLETPVPLLVYEFITNGSLSNHIHDYHRPKMPWQTRLKIATETAGVLAYLHTDHSPQIIHRDIKPANILLDDAYTSKVSDFGTSRLNPKDEDEMCSLVRGTLGYLDPEYLYTSQLTVKSDVYSFGVVLVELLTGLKVVSFERPEEKRSLVTYFLSLTKEDDLLAVLDSAMVNNDNIKEIKRVLKIAKMCVKVKCEERPTMKEVAMELEGIRKNLKHQWATGEASFEERQHWLGELPSKPYENSIQSTRSSSSSNDILLNIDDSI